MPVGIFRAVFTISRRGMFACGIEPRSEEMRETCAFRPRWRSQPEGAF